MVIRRPVLILSPFPRQILPAVSLYLDSLQQVPGNSARNSDGGLGNRFVSSEGVRIG